MHQESQLNKGIWIDSQYDFVEKNIQSSGVRLTIVIITEKGFCVLIVLLLVQWITEQNV